MISALAKDHRIFEKITDMNQKTRVAILFGGKSAEHEISLISGQNIINALDRNRFEPVLIGVDRSGGWFLQEEQSFLSLPADPKEIALTDFSRPLVLRPGDSEEKIIELNTGKPLATVGAVFAILHGPFGEDGAMQGLLKTLDLPFVGPGILGSAVGMDKDVCKRLMRDAGIPNAKFLVYRKAEQEAIDFAFVKMKLGMPVFIKPTNMGSSVGISRATDEVSFKKAISLAFEYDRKILIEEAVIGREIECAVLGNDYPKGTQPGEIIPEEGSFYSYAAKYIDEKGATLMIPAQDLDERTIERMKELAVQTFQVLCCEGLSRVDFFLKENGELIVNEINTLPGFTQISMYPKLWGLEGVSYADLITKLLELAIERHEQEQAVGTTHSFQ